MLIVTNLLVAFRVVVVGLLLGNLLKHQVDEHIYTRVGFDELLELLQDRVKVFWIFVDMIDDTLDPFFVDSVVSREPVAHSVGMRQFQWSRQYAGVYYL